MKQLVRNVRIAGTGSYVPENVVTNEELSQICGSSPEWIESTLGIKERRFKSPEQATSDLAAKAAIEAIQNAGLQPSDIELIIVATATPDRKAPSTAAFVQHKIHAINAAAFDVAAVCSGFLFAMSVGSQYIASGVYNKVLVIGADTFSTIIDWKRRDAVFFGDGAGAAVLCSAEQSSGFLAFRMYTDTTQRHLGFTVPAGGSEMPITPDVLDQGLQYFQMDGKAVYETALSCLPKAIGQVLQDANMTVSDVDLMIPHQPSTRILKATADAVGLPFEKVMRNMDKYANTSGGTIPIILDETHRKGLIKPGMNVLFAAIGSGWTYGAALIRWSDV